MIVNEGIMKKMMSILLLKIAILLYYLLLTLNNKIETNESPEIIEKKDKNQLLLTGSV